MIGSPHEATPHGEPYPYAVEPEQRQFRPLAAIRCLALARLVWLIGFGDSLTPSSHERVSEFFDAGDCPRWRDFEGIYRGLVRIQAPSGSDSVPAGPSSSCSCGWIGARWRSPDP